MSSETFFIRLEQMAELCQSLGTTANSVGKMANDASTEFNNAASAMPANEVHDALLTYSESWVPMLGKLADSCTQITKALSTAVDQYAQAEIHNAKSF